MYSLLFMLLYVIVFVGSVVCNIIDEIGAPDPCLSTTSARATQHLDKHMLRKKFL